MPMHLQPVFAECEVAGGAVAEDLFAHGLCLPSGTAMSEDEQARVVEVIRTQMNADFVRRSEKI